MTKPESTFNFTTTKQSKKKKKEAQQKTSDFFGLGETAMSANADRNLKKN